MASGATRSFVVAQVLVICRPSETLERKEETIHQQEDIFPPPPSFLREHFKVNATRGITNSALEFQTPHIWKKEMANNHITFPSPYNPFCTSTPRTLIISLSKNDNLLPFTSRLTAFQAKDKKLLTSFFQLGFLYFHGLCAITGTLGSASGCQRWPKVKEKDQIKQF